MIETVLQISGGSVQEVHPVLAAPFDADVETKMSGLKDFAEALAGTVQGNPGRGRPCRDRAVAGSAGRSGLGCRRHAEPQRPGADRRRIADDGGGHRESDPGARNRKDAGGGRAAGNARSRRPGREDAGPQQSVRRARQGDPSLGKASSRTPIPGRRRERPLGKEAELEGKKARAFPLRFVDGAVFLGTLKVGQVAAVAIKWLWTSAGLHSDHRWRLLKTGLAGTFSSLDLSQVVLWGQQIERRECS